MTAIQIFERCREAESDIKALRDRIARYRDSAARVTAIYDNIGGGHGSAEHDRLSAIVAEIDALEAAIAEREKKHAVEIAAACKPLDMLPEVECKIIDSFYIKRRALTAVARELSYSYGYVRTAKVTACKHLDDISEGIVNGLLPPWYRKQG